MIFDRKRDPEPDPVAFFGARLRRVVRVLGTWDRHFPYDAEPGLILHALRSTLLDLAALPGGDDEAYSVMVGSVHIPRIRAYLAQVERGPRRAG